MREYSQEETERFTKIYRDLQSTIEYTRDERMFHKLLEEALKEGYPLNYVPEDDCSSPLLNIAILQGKKEMIQILLDAGVDANLKDNDERNALMVACDKVYRHSFNIPLIKELIARTTDLNEKERWGPNALQMLVRNYLQTGFEGLLNCIEDIIKNGSDPSVLTGLLRNLSTAPPYKDNLEKLNKLLARLQIRSQIKEQLSRSTANAPEIDFDYEL